MCYHDGCVSSDDYEVWSVYYVCIMVFIIVYLFMFVCVVVINRVCVLVIMIDGVWVFIMFVFHGSCGAWVSIVFL